MKKAISVLLLLGVVSLTGCSASRSADNSTIASQTSNISLDNATSSVNYKVFHADYPHYGTIEEMKEKANLVFVGTVRNISFELLDMYTMKPVDNLESAGFPLINTIYEVEVNHAYSETSDTVVKVRIEGGVRDQLLDEQIAAAKSDTIIVQDDAPLLTNGESYLFALYLADDADYASIINPFQSIYSLESIDAQSDAQVFSAADIMSSYNDNAVSEFLNNKDKWLK